MTNVMEKPLTIGQTIQADQEPRRMRQLRNTLRAEREGAVCPLCQLRISSSCVRERTYEFDPKDNLVHSDCHRVALVNGYSPDYNPTLIMSGVPGKLQWARMPTPAGPHGNPRSPRACLHSGARPVQQKQDAHHPHRTLRTLPNVTDRHR